MAYINFLLLYHAITKLALSTVIASYQHSIGNFESSNNQDDIIAQVWLISTEFYGKCQTLVIEQVEHTILRSQFQLTSDFFWIRSAFTI